MLASLRQTPRLRHGFRLVALAATAVVLAPPAERLPNTLLELTDSGSAPAWAVDWIEGPRQPCRRAENRAIQGALSPAAAEDAADKYVAQGFLCAAAETLFEVAGEIRKTDTGAARRLLVRALELALQGDDGDLLGRIAERSASLEADDGNLRAAVVFNRAAQLFWQDDGNVEALLENGQNRAVALFFMGRLDEAEASLLAIIDALGGKPSRRALLAPALTMLARIAIANQQLPRAERLLDRALRARDPARASGMAATLDAYCRLRINQGDFLAAAELNRRVLDLSRGDTRSVANAVATQAEIALRRERYLEAISAARQSRRLIADAEASDPNLDIHTLDLEARAQRGLGQAELADACMEALLARLEAVRQSAQNALLIPFFAGRRRPIADWVDDLVARGKHTEAFEVAEVSRSRDLLDGLIWSPAKVREHATREQLLRDQQLRSDLARLAAELDAVTPSERSAAQALSSATRQLRLSLLALETEMRRMAGTQIGQPLSLRAVQDTLQPGTLVMYYWLGERRSFLWLLDRGRSEIHADLPSQAGLERAALRARDLLSRGRGSEEAAEAELRALGKVLLEPAAERLEGARSVVIVPDGALFEIPFAALALPASIDSTRRPLISLIPVSVAPSLSTMVAIREGVEDRRTRQRLRLVALGDPVYAADDDRMPSPTQRAPRVKRKERPRIPQSGREAEAIVKNLQTEDYRLMLGFDASRAAVLDGALAGSRYIHLGAHADLDWNDPELSAIFLSSFDATGTLVDGALRIQDLDQLNLSADLVVLAGCRTGLGRNYIGEGTLAFPRGFALAGAAAVVASLWPVEDEPTARLVQDLWHGVLSEGLSPSEALRRAQLALGSDPRWRSPAAWASFVLLGDGAS